MSLKGDFSRHSMSFQEIHCREGTLFSGKKQACGLKVRAADMEGIRRA